MKHLYLLFGIGLLTATAFVELRGWSPARVTEVRDVPRTVRENPGSYRPHYVFIGSGPMRGK
jgi:hypothetical protein